MITIIIIIIMITIINVTIIIIIIIIIQASRIASGIATARLARPRRGGA